MRSLSGSPATLALRRRGRRLVGSGRGGCGTFPLDQIGESTAARAAPPLDIRAYRVPLARRVERIAQVRALILAQEPRRILGVRLIDQGVLLVRALGSAVVDTPVDVGGVLSRQELVGEREARPKAQGDQPQPKLPHGVTRR